MSTQKQKRTCLLLFIVAFVISIGLGLFSATYFLPASAADLVNCCDLVEGGNCGCDNNCINGCITYWCTSQNCEGAGTSTEKCWNCK